jgi:hypothetical protein
MLFSNGQKEIVIKENKAIVNFDDKSGCPFTVYWKNGKITKYSAHRSITKGQEDLWIAEAVIINCIASNINQ